MTANLEKTQTIFLFNLPLWLLSQGDQNSALNSVKSVNNLQKHTGTIPVKFGEIKLIGLGGGVILSKSMTNVRQTAKAQLLKAAYSVTMNIFRIFLFSFKIICKSRIKLCFHNKNVQYS